jgi:hypothetical protein
VTVTQDVRVQIVSRDNHGIVVRLPDGEERRIAGTEVSLVYCSKGDLDDAIAGKQDPDVSVDFTLMPSGGVLCFGTANRI